MTQTPNQEIREDFENAVAFSVMGGTPVEWNPLEGSGLKAQGSGACEEHLASLRSPWRYAPLTRRRKTPTPCS